MAVVKQAEPVHAPAPTKVVKFPPPARVKNAAAVALGKMGGSKGGKIRAERLSTERKKEIASLAAKARWDKERAE